MTGRAAHVLLAWVPEVAVEAVHTGVIEPESRLEFRQLARSARKKPLQLAPLASPAEMGDPDPSVADLVSGLTGRPMFEECYAGFGARVAKIPLAGLVTPQWSADMDFVGELRGRLPSASDERALFEYCFAEDELGEASVIHGGQAWIGVVNVPRGQPPRIGKLVAQHSLDRRSVTFSISLDARPHLVHVVGLQTVIQQGLSQSLSQRILVLDGVHRLLALLADGREHAYALVLDELPASQIAAYMGGGGPGVLLDAATSAPRPPRLDDYLDPAVFDRVRIPALDSTFGVVVTPQMQKRPDGVSVEGATEATLPVAGTQTETLPRTDAVAGAGGPAGAT